MLMGTRESVTMFRVPKSDRLQMNELVQVTCSDYKTRKVDSLVQVNDGKCS